MIEFPHERRSIGGLPSANNRTIRTAPPMNPHRAIPRQLSISVPDQPSREITFLAFTTRTARRAPPTDSQTERRAVRASIAVTAPFFERKQFVKNCARGRRKKNKIRTLWISDAKAHISRCSHRASGGRSMQHPARSRGSPLRCGIPRRSRWRRASPRALRRPRRCVRRLSARPCSSHPPDDRVTSDPRRG